MATRARIRLVNRSRQLRDIYEQGNLFAGSVGFGQRLIGVTIQAKTVFEFFTSGWAKVHEDGKHGCCQAHQDTSRHYHTVGTLLETQQKALRRLAIATYFLSGVGLNRKERKEGTGERSEVRRIRARVWSGLVWICADRSEERRVGKECRSR